MQYIIWYEDTLIARLWWYYGIDLNSVNGEWTKELEEIISFFSHFCSFITEQWNRKCFSSSIKWQYPHAFSSTDKPQRRPRSISRAREFTQGLVMAFLYRNWLVEVHFKCLFKSYVSPWNRTGPIIQTGISFFNEIVLKNLFALFLICSRISIVNIDMYISWKLLYLSYPHVKSLIMQRHLTLGGSSGQLMGWHVQ